MMWIASSIMWLWMRRRRKSKGREGGREGRREGVRGCGSTNLKRRSRVR